MNDNEEVLIVNGCPILRRHHGLSIEDFVKLEVRRVSNPTEIQEVLPLLGCVHPEKRRKKGNVLLLRKVLSLLGCVHRKRRKKGRES